MSAGLAEVAVNLQTPIPKLQSSSKSPSSKPGLIRPSRRSMKPGVSLVFGVWCLVFSPAAADLLAKYYVKTKGIELARKKAKPANP